MILEAKGLTLEYPDGLSKRKVLDNINLSVKPKETVVLCGPSGSGKSSLIYLLSTLKRPSAGTVAFDNMVISNNKNADFIRLQNFGFVFQQHFLIPYLSVLENICIMRKDRKKISDAYHLMEDLRIETLANKKPHQISGGERQRVAIARALMNNPKVVFADEPTASLDKENANKIYSLLKNRTSDAILIIATHDMSLLEGDERIIKVENSKIWEN
ncbi:MAG TPA: ABC transporter ATP-binding protein [Clostridiales bacterium]|nr:ABC transporter ATP-binding protein [Clostridiales bacterium]